MSQHSLRFMQPVDDDVCVNLNLLNSSTNELTTNNHNTSFTCIQRSVDSDIYSDAYLIKLLSREPFRMTKPSNSLHSGSLKMTTISQNTNNNARVSQAGQQKRVRRRRNSRTRYGYRRKYRKNKYLHTKAGINKNRSPMLDACQLTAPVVGINNESNAKGDLISVEAGTPQSEAPPKPSRLSRFNIFSRLTAFALRLYRPKSTNLAVKEDIVVPKEKKTKQKPQTKPAQKQKGCFFCGSNCSQNVQTTQSSSNSSSNNCFTQPQEMKPSLGVKITNVLGARAGQSFDLTGSSERRNHYLTKDFYEHRPNVVSEMNRLSLNAQKPRLSWIPWFRNDPTSSVASEKPCAIGGNEGDFNQLRIFNNMNKSEYSENEYQDIPERICHRVKRRRSVSSEGSPKSRTLSCRSRSRTRR